MNQAVKCRVYGQGAQKHVDLVDRISGMTEEQTKVFHLLHKGWADIDIAAELGMDAKAYTATETEVSKKLNYAVLACMDFCINNNMT